ncbi:MAG: gamma-glutamyltransferase [Cryobacterium sp.]|nr:gamma-glutamyltransferase [Oligoflexia bacterium]
MQPSIELARGGTEVTEELSEALTEKKSSLEFFPESRAIFLKKNGSLPVLGEPGFY